MKEAEYWKMSDGGPIECTLCPRHCRIADGKRGQCFGRRRIGNKLIAETYGLVCGLAVDPIEKKPLNHFLPGSSVLSFGTVGCNLICGFCQNFHLSQPKKLDGTPVTPEEIAETALRYECESVAFTYNEPTVFLEFAVDTAIVCHEHGLKTVAVTNGWIEPEPRKELYRHIDAANVDLKAFTDSFYKNLCGATLQPVLDTLVYLKKETSVHLEVTTLIIPGKNDSPEEIDAMTKWAVSNLGPDVPWHFSAYHPTATWRDAPVTPAETLFTAKSIAEANGLQHIHIGNLGITI
ncbi:AmmeMemoRadiSam system radical SAM enzyme [Tichowtungia aerotolerans]|uniref:AmmeMemoRadiSam system radical SAM enzyme n=1 Tax=Tichowtungia aerotolerans TaxID=2697043 RepID=A0A6P1MAI4_9BACT|nr:AmmeMemoRadiSam system radical SAM enzyme [Tichowtungia aerotolerans]QHI69564.1 AmmeMemoRadiSam system radical SAM enzyme [Tichowtungia aerotolerans]